MMYDLIGNVGWVLEKRFKTCVGDKKKGGGLYLGSSVGSRDEVM
jgi:hypothetical protein